MSVKPNLSVFVTNSARALGMTTFLLLPLWGEVLGLRAIDLQWLTLIDIALTTILITLIFSSLWTFRRSSGFIIGIAIIFIFILIGYDSLQYIYDSLRMELIKYDLLDNHKTELRWTFWCLIGVASVLMVHLRKKVTQFVDGFTGIFAILFFIFLLQFLYIKLNRAHIGVAEDVTQKKASIVVLIFDELDAQILTTSIHELPAFMELKRRSQLQGNVYPPANYTHISIPAMLLGRPILGTEMAAGTAMFIAKDGVKRESLPTAQHLFKLLAEGGNRLSIVGWHLPYCALFSEVQRCLDDSEYGVPGGGMTTLEWIYGKSSLLFKYRQATNPALSNDLDRYANLFFHDPRNFKLNQISSLLNNLEERLLQDITSHEFDVIFAHLPCPHLPRADGAITQGALIDYQDNLQRCDQILGRVMKAMDNGGFSSIKLIVTSDHWFRVLDWISNGKVHQAPRAPRLVPFFYFENDRRFLIKNLQGGNNVSLKDFVTAVSRDSLSPSTEELSSIINRYGSNITVLESF